MKMDYVLGLSEEGFHRIAYTEWGQPEHNQNLTLCIHGLTRNGRDFDALAEYLEHRGRHVFCPDVVGRGESDWLRNPLHYTFEQYIADMNALIARSHATSVDFIGTSMGGIIGMMMASLPNTPIRRLVLNDVGPQIPAAALGRLAKYAGQDPEFTSLEEAKRYYKVIYADFGTLTDTQWQHLTEHNVRQLASGKFASKIDQSVKASQTKSKLAWNLLINPHKALEGTLFDLDLWQTWRKVSCPVLVIHGARSDLLLPAVIEKMHSTHRNLEVLEVLDAGHAPALLEPEQHAVIYEWLNKNR